MVAAFVCGWLVMFVVGCDRMANSLQRATVTEVKAATPPEPEPEVETDDLADTGWVGTTEAEIEAEFGKPRFMMQTADGTVWHYPRQRVVFSAAGRVVSVERDVTSASPRPPMAVKEAIAPGSTHQAQSAASPHVTRIAQGGAAVDLGKILRPDRVTIVDFYADWCGPCRKIAPFLDRMAREYDVDLVKIDIVRWGTPVTRQMKINSIPNIWVFDGNLARVGSPTHDLQQVQRYVLNAKTR